MISTRSAALLLSVAGAAQGQVFAGTPAPTPYATKACLGAGWFEDTFWADMPPMAQAAAVVLEYDQGIWDLGGYSVLQATYWEYLTETQQGAASALGCPEDCWDWCN